MSKFEILRQPFSRQNKGTRRKGKEDPDYGSASSDSSINTDDLLEDSDNTPYRDMPHIGNIYNSFIY